METKQKMFRFTPRTVDLLKIVAGLNQLSETEMLEVALEAIANPEALQLINSIHGDRVSRKSLRKPRTIKPKVNDAPKDPSESEDKVLSILKKARANQINITNKQENQINNVQEIEIVEQVSEEVEEIKTLEIEETIAVSLDTIDDSLLEMYG